jgi:hypothetical protein
LGMVKASNGRRACWLGLALVAAACGGESQHNPRNQEPETGGSGPAAAGGSGTGKAGSASAVAGSSSTTGGAATSGGAATTGAVASGGEEADPTAGAPSDPASAGAGNAGDGGSGSEPEPSCDPIVFEDPDFEAAVRAGVNKPNGALTSADVVGLTFVGTGGVKSIRGAECLTNLTEFSIGSLPFGKVTDLSPLAPLKKLETVDVGLNPLASVAPLGNLPKLKQLFMSTVPTVLDLTPLASAPALEVLYLQKDTVVSLAPLGAVSTLVTLNLRQATVQYPAGAAAHQSVKVLVG